MKELTVNYGSDHESGFYKCTSMFIAEVGLTHFCLIFPLYTPYKHQKTFGFLVFSGGIKCVNDKKWFNEVAFFGSYFFLIERMSYLMLLTYFRSIFTFYSPWKHKETRGHLMFSGAIKRQISQDLFQDNVFLCFYAAGLLFRKCLHKNTIY